eukprot:scaffold15319_cov52-Phaeocystis_antarctica.AAC.4
MITHGAVLCGETPQCDTGPGPSTSPTLTLTRCDGCPLRSCCEYGSLLRPPPAAAPAAAPAAPGAIPATGPSQIAPQAPPLPLQLSATAPPVAPTAATADVTMAEASPATAPL